MLHAGTIFFPHESMHAISVPILVEHIYSQAVHSLFAVFAADLHISKQINFECFAHSLGKFKKYIEEELVTCVDFDIQRRVV